MQQLARVRNPRFREGRRLRDGERQTGTGRDSWAAAYDLARRANAAMRPANFAERVTSSGTPALW